MNRLLPVSLGLAAGAALLVATTAGPATAGPRTTIQTALTGAQEVPSPGDPDGRGNGVVKVDTASGEICVVITANRVQDLRAGHIHEKAEGQEVGGVAIALEQTGPRKFQGCTTDREVADGLLSEPEEYYLNVHNAEFPGGALRGDLG